MSRRIVHKTVVVWNKYMQRDAQCKVYKDSETGEFVVRYFDDHKVFPSADAFETDLQSAIGTANALLGL